MKKGSLMPTMRTLSLVACLAALSGLPATAHHETASGRHYLAFWSGRQFPSGPSITDLSCRNDRFWMQGFVSIYPQGTGNYK
jgi:hypothetical protein